MGSGQNRGVKNEVNGEAMKGYKSKIEFKSQQFPKQQPPESVFQSQKFNPQPAFEVKNEDKSQFKGEEQNQFKSEIGPPPPIKAIKVPKSTFPQKQFPFDGPECVEDELALRIQKQFKDFALFLDDTNMTLEKILKKKNSEVY